MNNDPTRILLVDNQVDAREWLAEQLQVSYGFRVDTVSDGEEAISRVRANVGQYHVMVIDLRLGSGLDGIETMKVIQAECPDIETIIITGFGSIEDGIRAIQQGACNFILKPVNHEQLAVYISSADERRRLRMAAMERDWLQHLLDLSQSMSSSVTPEDVAEQIYESVQRLFPQVDAFYIAIREPDQNRTRSLLAVDKGSRSPFTCEDSFGLAGEVIRNRRPLFIDDLLNNGNQITTRSFNAGRPARSYAGVPLMSGNGNEVVGVLSAQSYEPFAFNNDHKQLLKDMASRGAIIIENALLHQQTSRRLLVLSKLYETIATLRMQSSLDSVLDVIVNNLQELFVLDTCTIGLLDRKKTKFEFRAVKGFEEKITRLLTDLPTQMVQHAFNTTEPIVIQNVDDFPELKRVLEIPDLKSFIVFPLHGKKKKLLGIIDMGSKGSIELSTEDWNLLKALADQAAIAIEDDQLREDRQEWISQLLMLDQVALDIANETERKTLLRKIIERATGLTHGTGGGIYLLTEDGTHLVLEAAFEMTSDFKEGMRVDPKVGVMGEVLRTRKPFAKSDYSQWPDRSKIFDPLGFTVVAGAPIFSPKGHLLGGIAVHTNKKGGEFSRMELDSLSRFGWFAGAEIDKAGLLGELDQKSATLELLLDFSNRLAEAPNVDEALRIFVEKMMEACPSSFCHVLLRTRGGDRLRVRKASAAPRHKALEWHSSEGEQCGVFNIRSTEEIVQDQNGVVLNRGDEATADELLSKIDAHLSLETPLQSVLLLPLRIGDKIVGLCFLGEIRKAQADKPKSNGPDRRQFSDAVSFTPENIKLAEALASQAATRIEHFRVLRVEEERSNALKHLSEVGYAIAATLDRDQVLKMIVEHGRKLLGAEACAIFLVNRERTLTLEATDGSPGGSFQTDPIEIGPDVGLTGFIASKGEIFKMRGKRLREHPAIKNRGRQRHLRSGFCESLLVIPLKRRSGEKEELIGLIKVENKQDRAGKLDMGNGFDADDEFILKTLADCAVTAIQNGQVFGLTRTLERVAKVVNSTLDLDEVLQEVLTELRHLIPFDTSSIQLVSRGELKIVASDGFDEHDRKKVSKLSFPLLDSKFPNHKVIRTKEPFLIADIRASRYRHFWDEADVYLSGHIRSWLGVPLLHGDDVVGMISIESETSERYTDLDKDLGKAFASCVVPAIMHAKLHKSTQSLFDITQDITKQLGLDIVLEKIAMDAVNKEGFIGADIAILYLYNLEESVFNEEPVYKGGPLNEPDQINPPFSDDSVLHRLIKEKKYYFASDVSSDPFFAMGFIRREGVKSAAAFPLLVGNKPVGAMFVNFLDTHIFSAFELGLLNLFAQQAAIAIQNARQYEPVRRKLQEDKAIARAGILASIFAHDVKTPTLSIRLLATTLRSSVSDDKSQEDLNQIERYVKAIEDSFPVLPPRLEEESVELSRALNEMQAGRKEEFSRYGIILETNLDEMPLVKGNLKTLVYVFDCLAKNAIRFMPHGGKLTFSGRVEDHRLLLEVVDTGPGFSENVSGALYDGQARDPDSGGSGYGLYLSKYALEEFDGYISRPKRDERGNFFTLNLPVAEFRGE